MRKLLRFHTIIVETRRETIPNELLPGDSITINDRDGNAVKVTVEKDRRVRIRFNPDEMTADVVPANWEAQVPLTTG